MKKTSKINNQAIDSSELILAMDELEKEQGIKKDVLLEAVEQAGWTCCYASTRLKGDKDVILRATHNDGQVLYFASKELRDDKEVVISAVSNKPIILKYASYRLRSDKDVAITAVSKGKQKVLDYITPNLREDEDIRKLLEN